MFSQDFCIYYNVTTEQSDLFCMWFTVQMRGKLSAFFKICIPALLTVLVTSPSRCEHLAVGAWVYLRVLCLRVIYIQWGCSNNGCAAGAILLPDWTQSFTGQGWQVQNYLLTGIIYFSNSLTRMELFPRLIVELVLIQMTKYVHFIFMFYSDRNLL